MRPTSSITARYLFCKELIDVSVYLTFRNLCALDWTQSDPLGSTFDFKLHYDSLSVEGKQVRPHSQHNF